MPSPAEDTSSTDSPWITVHPDREEAWEESGVVGLVWKAGKWMAVSPSMDSTRIYAG